MTVAKQLKKDFWTKTVSIALAIATMVLFLPQLYHFGVALQPHSKVSVDGQIVLNKTDFADRNMIALGGDWQFFWGQLLSPNELSDAPVDAININGEGGWQSAVNGKAFPAKGFASYHLSVTLQGEIQNLALRIPHIETAYRLYVDNVLVASAGIVSEKESKSVPGYNSAVILLPQRLKDFSITLQTSNYHSIWGGLWSPIIIGDADSIYTLNQDKVAFSMFILGVLLITAIHSSIQYFLMPSQKGPLIFASLCLILFLREMTSEHLYNGLTGLGFGFTALKKLSYLTFYAGFPVALYFIHVSYSTVFGRKTTNIFYVVAILFSVFVVVSPVFYIGQSLFAFQLIAIGMMLYTISRIFVAAKQKQVGAKVMMVGVIIISLFVLNDILYLAGFLMTGRFLSLGLIGFIICQSYVVNDKTGSLISRNKKLTSELKDRNSELEVMSELLETKVELRTQQLKVANKELKLLANVDKLTNTLNRHGLQHHLIAAFERFRRTKEVFSIVLLDYDNFKVINDSFGHDVGDIVLKTGSDIIKECIREQDKLARWGGEEFLILLPNTNLEGAKSIANKLRLTLQEQSFDETSLGLRVTVTGGVGVVQENETFEMVFKRVDTALYKGKHSGKNCIYG